MNKLLPSILFLAMVGAPCVSEASVIKHKIAKKETVAASRAAAFPTSMAQCVSAAYDPQDDEVADYYIIFTSKDDARWSKEDGVTMSDGYALYLDMYSAVSNPVTLADGKYTASSGCEAMTYDPDYSYLSYFNESGKETTEYEITGDVTVTQKNAGIYQITADVMNGSEKTTVTFEGSISFVDGTIPPSVYNQIRRDLDLELNGALAFYDGNLYESNTGAMYINLYDHAFNDYTGGMTEDGCSLALMVFGKLFSNSSEATLDPGTYSVARNFNRHTWFPGLEVDYAGTTVMIGSYAKERNVNKYTDGYGYSYLAEGTIVIEDMGAGVFKITVDAVTTLGNTIKATFQGEVPVVDQAVSDKKTAISTLEDDVELNLDPIPVCRIFSTGIVNNCQCFIVDIGSPQGRDGITEGDIMRMEFVLPEGTQHLMDGTYTVMEDKYDGFYEPFKLTRGRFVSTSSGGTDLSGTRYMHFIEGRNLVMDHHAPAAAGTVGVQKNADDTYTFTIALQCDAQFHIDGTWTGPMEYMYDPELIAGIEEIGTDGDTVEVEWIDESTLRVAGNAANVVAVYDLRGLSMPCEINGETVNVSNLASGIYILKVNEKTVKIVKK